MVNQTDALARLNKEKGYEDKLAADLSDYFITSLDYISDLNESLRETVREGLNTISSESRGHNHKFNMLIQMIVENGEDNY